jgi:biotin operon repressor
MQPGRTRARGLRLEPERFAEVERLAIYEIGNAVLLAHSNLQRAFGLRAEEFQVFYLVAIATAQRHVRGASRDAAKLDNTPLDPEQSGAISRRRISETLGIPLETVRRHVTKLVAQGLLVERGRGRIATSGGTLARLSATGVTRDLARQQVALANALIQLGVVTTD